MTRLALRVAVTAGVLVGMAVGWMSCFVSGLVADKGRPQMPPLQRDDRFDVLPDDEPLPNPFWRHQPAGSGPAHIAPNGKPCHCGATEEPA